MGLKKSNICSFSSSRSRKICIKKKRSRKILFNTVGRLHICTPLMTFENSFSHFEEKIIYFRQSPHFFNFRQKPPLKYLKIILISNDRPTKVAIIKIYFRQNPHFFNFRFCCSNFKPHI